MLSKEEIEMLEELTNRCKNCGEKEELGCCTDCYIDESEMNIIRKLFVEFKQLETNNKKLIEKLEKDKKKWQEFHNRVPEVPKYIDYILPFVKGENNGTEK